MRAARPAAAQLRAPLPVRSITPAEIQARLSHRLRQIVGPGRRVTLAEAAKLTGINARTLKAYAASRIPLTVCPLSNLKLKVVRRLEDHAMARLLRAGLAVTMNSDDPSYFGGYMNENYLATQAALGLSREEIREIARNGVAAAFVDARRRAELSAMLEGYWAKAG